MNVSKMRNVKLHADVHGALAALAQRRDLPVRAVMDILVRRALADTELMDDVEQACEAERERRANARTGQPRGESRTFDALRTLGEAHGWRLVEIVLAEFGGTKPHHPSAKNFWATLERLARDRAICEKFDGRPDSYAELAAEFCLHPRQVRKILRHDTIARRCGDGAENISRAAVEFRLPEDKVARIINTHWRRAMKVET